MALAIEWEFRGRRCGFRLQGSGQLPAGIIGTTQRLVNTGSRQPQIDQPMIVFAEQGLKLASARPAIEGTAYPGNQTQRRHRRHVEIG
ncbi:hypothetical protein [Salinisphaera sp. LB1]|uniref:hypothetical protein n=1 Tax=Salinisphaera sp. LB1 TaxID=2183911 RepID=UPI000D707D2F|nr:hypothetical protein [Salinisphaera sp. LB1]AWN16718.1 hypothetical protein SALB1_2520 [Salinisphaera sp. LB1]